MKITKENYEMILFDLLEGNLSPAEANQVKAQIAKDNFLRLQWKAMQATVLVDTQTITFSRKSKLLKEEKPTRILWPWVAIPAAAVLLIGIMLFQQKDIPKTLTYATPFLDDQEISPNLKSEIAHPNEKSLITTEPTENGRISQKTYSQTDDKKKAVPQVQNLALEGKKVSKEASFLYASKQVSIPYSSSFALPEIKAEEIITPSIVDEIEELEVSKKYLAAVTNTMFERINKTKMQAMALRNPKLTISSTNEGKNKSLQIGIETTGYQAFAYIKSPLNRN